MFENWVICGIYCFIGCGVVVIVIGWFILIIDGMVMRRIRNFLCKLLVYKVLEFVF